MIGLRSAKYIVKSWKVPNSIIRVVSDHGCMNPPCHPCQPRLGGEGGVGGSGGAGGGGGGGAGGGGVPSSYSSATTTHNIELCAPCYRALVVLVLKYRKKCHYRTKSIKFVLIWCKFLYSFPMSFSLSPVQYASCGVFSTTLTDCLQIEQLLVQSFHTFGNIFYKPVI